MNTLTNDFNEFLNLIGIDASTKKDIQNKHTSFSSMINKADINNYEIISTHLSGSYAKHTEINEPDNKNPDVDLVVFFNTNVKDPNKIYNDFYNYIYDKKISKTKEIRKQSNSIGLKYEDIDMDIVLAPNCNIEDLKIVSVKEQNIIDSNCLKHVEYLINRNQQFKDNTFSFYSLHKLFKYINKFRINNKIKSFTLEMLINNCCPKPKNDDELWHMFLYTLENIINITSIELIKDCCDKNKQGYDDKDIFIFTLFKSELISIYNLTKEAISGKRTNWNLIFGDLFPQQEDVQNNNIYDRTQTPWIQ